MGSGRRWIGALVAGAVPLVVGQGVAAAAFAEGEQSLTFTYDGGDVICRLYGQSDVVDGDGSAASTTNGDIDPRCASHLSVTVRYVDTGGVHRTSGASTASGDDVGHTVQGVRDSFSATHTVRFVNCENPTDPSACELSFTTTPK
jgi:hypothetical protein